MNTDTHRLKIGILEDWKDGILGEKKIIDGRLQDAHIPMLGRIFTTL